MKKTLIILILVLVHQFTNAQVKVLGKIEPNGATDKYPTHVDSLGRGGLMAAASWQERNAIPTERRKAGMLVRVKSASVDSTYTLGVGLTNTDWVPFVLGGSSGSIWGSITGSIQDQMDLKTVLDAKISKRINVTYAELASLISSNQLVTEQVYLINDYQTVHTIQGTSELNIGPVEPLLVKASGTNALYREAFSTIYPSDFIEYSIDNASGSTKGRMLRRIDTKKNVSVPNDFRNVKYRRWKFNPVEFNSANAYSRYACVLYNNAIYYCNKTGGFTAGAATEPSATSDDWIQMISDNTHHWAYTFNSYTFTTSNSTNVNPRNVIIPVNANDYVDNVMFPGYGDDNKFYNITFANFPGTLVNAVFFHKGQASVANNLDFGTQSGYLSILVDAGSMSHLKANAWVYTSFFHIKGTFSHIRTNIMQNAWFNASYVDRINGDIWSSLIRGSFYNVNTLEWRYCVFPNEFKGIYTNSRVTGLKFSSNAHARNWSMVTNFSEYSGTIPVMQPDIYITSPLDNKTFIGNSQADYFAGTILQDMINRAGKEDVVIYPNPDDLKRVATNYTATNIDHAILVNTTAADRTITLPDPSKVNIGKIIRIYKDKLPNRAFVNAENAGTINGGSSYEISSIGYVDFVKDDGAGWVTAVNTVLVEKANLAGGNTFTGNQNVAGEVRIMGTLYPEGITIDQGDVTFMNGSELKLNYEGDPLRNVKLTHSNISISSNYLDFPMTTTLVNNVDAAILTRTVVLPATSGTLALTSDVPKMFTYTTIENVDQNEIEHNLGYTPTSAIASINNYINPTTYIRSVEISGSIIVVKTSTILPVGTKISIMVK